MYLRMMNRLDVQNAVKIIEEYIQSTEATEQVLDRIRKATEILDAHYGGQRSPKDMGGFVFFMTGEQEREVILNYYQLDEELAEYSDVVCTDDSVTWKEELYLRGSDDGIVILYPAK